VDGGNTVNWFPSTGAPPGTTGPGVLPATNCASTGACPQEEPPAVTEEEEEKEIEEAISTSVFVCEGIVDVNTKLVKKQERAIVGMDRVAHLIARALYVGNVEGVKVLRSETRDLVKTFRMRERPAGLTISDPTNMLYAVLGGEGQMLYGIGTSTITHQMRNDIVGLDSGASDAVVNKEGTIGYVANSISDNIQVIDLKTREVIKTFATGSKPIQLALTRDGKYLYVINQLDRTISKINTENGKEDAVFSAGQTPTDLVLSLNEKELYVADQAVGKVLILKANPGEKIGEIEVGQGPQALALDPLGKKLFVSNRDSNTLSIINTDTRQKLADVKIGEKPYGMAVTPEGTEVYVANMISGDVSLVNVPTQLEVDRIPVGTGPTHVALSPLKTPRWCMEILEKQKTQS
jgi:YVTN family beta-propeller protein